MKKHKKIILSLIFILSLSILTTTNTLNASSLTPNQIQAIISLLKSFGADSNTISKVQASLEGKTPHNSNTPSTNTNRPDTATKPPFCQFLNTVRFRLGMRSPQVTQLQQFLKSTGDFTYGEFTTYYGTQTKRAVQRYQCREMKLCSGSPSVNGYGLAGPGTRRHICNTAQQATQAQTSQTTSMNTLNITRTLSLGTRGEDVKQLQQHLKNKGYYTGHVGGYFGPLTQRAVQKYQCGELSICSGSPHTNGYGVVGPKTRAALRSAQISAANTPTRNESAQHTPSFGGESSASNERTLRNTNTTHTSHGNSSNTNDSNSNAGEPSGGSGNTSGVGSDGSSSGSGGGTLSANTTSNTPASCGSSPSGTTQTRIRYQNASEPFGTQCKQETQSRTCTNGEWTPWSGTYTNISCSTQGASSCQISGLTLSHGESKDFYDTNTVPYGQSCDSHKQTRTCNNGTLSGDTTFSKSTCTPQDASSCTLDGVTVAHGNSHPFYSTTSVTRPVTCDTYKQTRTCINGTLSGDSSFSHASCLESDPLLPSCTITTDATSVVQGQSFSMSWQSNNTTSATLANSLGLNIQTQTSGTRTANTASVPLGPINYTLTVANTIGATAQCTTSINVSSPASCALDNTTVHHGSSRYFYKPSVPFGQCGSSTYRQARACINGTLSGDSAFNTATCNEQSASSCNFNNQTIPHGQSITAYQSQTVPHGQICKSQTRTCSNGHLSGSYSYASCSVEEQQVTYLWHTGEWGQCVNGEQTRSVTCKGVDGKTYADNKCSHTKPVTTQPCVASGSITAFYPLKKYDILLSPRFGKNSSGWDSAITNFNPTKLTWMYESQGVVRDTNQRSIEIAQEYNLPINCAIPYWLYADDPDLSEMACKDKNGNLVKKGNGLYLPDIHSAKVKNHILTKLKKYIRLGCWSFQQDDPSSLYDIEKQTECHSPSSDLAYARYKQTHKDANRLTFWRDSIIEYRRWLRNELNQYASSIGIQTPITFSGNFGAVTTNKSWIYPEFDFAQGELLGNAKMPELLFRFAENVSRYPFSIVTNDSGDTRENRQFFAAAYALGLNPIIPWDVYVPRQNRFYGDVNDYRSLLNIISTYKNLFGDTEIVKKVSLKTTSKITRVVNKSNNIAVSWTKSQSVKNIPKNSIVTIDGSSYLTTGDTTIGLLYLPLSAKVSVGQNVESIVTANGDKLFPANTYNILSNDIYHGVRVFDAEALIVGKIENQNNTGLQWIGGNTHKIIPKGAQIKIDSHKYTTVGNTTVGLLYVSKNDAENVVIKTLIDDITHADGDIFIPTDSLFSIRSRADGVGNVAHIVNFENGKKHLFVKILKSEFPTAPKWLITDTRPDKRRVNPYKVTDSYYIYDLGNVDIWAILY